MKQFFKSVYMYFISARYSLQYFELYLFSVGAMLFNISLNNRTGYQFFYCYAIFMIYQILNPGNHLSCKIFTTNQYSRKIKTSTILFVNFAAWISFLIIAIILRFVFVSLFSYNLYFTDILLVPPLCSVISALGIILSQYAHKIISIFFAAIMFIPLIFMVADYKPDLHLNIPFYRALIMTFSIFIVGYAAETALARLLLSKSVKEQPKI